MPTQDKNRQSRMNTGSTALADPIVILKNDEMKKRVPVTIPPSLTNLAQPNNEKMKQTAAEKTGLMYQGNILKRRSVI